MQSDISKVHQLQFKESKQITLFSAHGHVLSIRQFAEKHLELLNKIEQGIIQDMTSILRAEQPFELPHPLVRTAKYTTGFQEIPARRCGTRSAYIQKLGLKIKGCRPEDAKFPHWELTKELNIETSWLPFGVLDAEGVMREILAYCFTKKYSLPSPSEPFAVFEYGQGETLLSYGLVSKDAFDPRLEEFIDDKGITVHSLVRIVKRPDAFAHILGREVGLIGIELQDYIELKTDLLIAFNFRGAFRGILNSNIGNDIVRNSALHSLCDFDSFIVLPVPSSNEQSEIRRFVIRAFIELIKTSLPFVDYINFDSQTTEEIHRSLSAYYIEKSSLFRRYKDKFLERAGELGWDITFVESCIREALSTPVSFELLQELVPNSHTFKTFRNESFYVPHR